MKAITPCLWFDTEAEDAAKFYCSVFKNSKIGSVTRYGETGPGPAGSVMIASFKIEGQEYRLINDDSVEGVVADPRGITKV